MRSLSIVIPCYNESEAIPGVLASIERVRAQLLGDRLLADCQVLVVDDASQDETPHLLRAYQWIDMIRLPRRSGYGAALKAGFRAARGDAIAFIDLDGTYDPLDLPRMWAVFQGKELVLGNRLPKGEGMPWVRAWGNLFFAWLVRKLYRQSVEDVCSGCRLFPRSWLPEILGLPNNGLDFSLALTLWALRRGRAIREIPILYHFRTGHSKLSVWLDGNRFLWTILRGRYAPARDSQPYSP